MSNFLNGFLDNTSDGLTHPKGNVGDFSHAAKLYNANAFQYAPKVKFLYHVVFNLNPLASTMLRSSDKTAINLLVKSVDLPKYKVQIDTIQQYNRKKNIQTKLTYDPVNLVFHDDNSGATTKLWSTYYNYYYADSKSSGSSGSGIGSIIASASNFASGNLLSGVTGLLGGGSSILGNPYQRTAYQGSILNRAKYGLDNGSVVPFFTSIQIFQLSKHTYQSYTLVNPIISAWQHDSMDQSAGGETCSSSMTINYEAVQYDTGTISEDEPAGFATVFYDKVHSPLSINGETEAPPTQPKVQISPTIIAPNIINNQASTQTTGYVIKNAMTNAAEVNVSGVANVAFPNTAGQVSTTIARAGNVQNNGPLPEATVNNFFNKRPGSLDSLAKTTMFQKIASVGNINDLNAAWNNLPQSQKDIYKQQALNAVINGAPEVQAQYNMIKNNVQ